MLDYWDNHEQKQIFAKTRRLGKSPDSGIVLATIYGLGFDRWSFFVFSKTGFLISLYSYNDYLYYNYKLFPCPIVGEEIKERLDRIFEYKDEFHTEPVKKQTEREKKLQRQQGFIDAMKKGEKVGFVNKIGKRIRK